MIPFHLYGLILAGSGAVLAAYLLLRRKSKSADDLERERREWLDPVRRLTGGTAIGVQEKPAREHKAFTFLVYQYHVAGVAYANSHDVSYLPPPVHLPSRPLPV